MIAENKKSENPYFFFNVHDDMHTIIKSYLLGIINIRLEDYEAAAQYASQLENYQSPDLMLSVEPTRSTAESNSRVAM